MAIPLAKKLKQHDLVKDLEGKLTVAISEERRQGDEENKEKYEKYEKLKEERGKINKLRSLLDRIQEEVVTIRKRKIASEATVKNQWNLFFITHVDNLESILKKGILSPNNVDKLGIQPKEISNESIVNTRKRITVGGKNLVDYAHVFFNPKNAFLYSVLEEEKKQLKKLGSYTHTKIVIIELTCDVSDEGIYITNKNAAVEGFDPKIDAVSGLDYYEIIPKIQEDTLPIGRRWSKRKNWDSEADKSKLMAECLVPDKISPEHFESIHVYNSDMEEKIQSLLTEPKLKIKVDPFMFFDGGY